VSRTLSRMTGPVTLGKLYSQTVMVRNVDGDTVVVDIVFPAYVSNRDQQLMADLRIEGHKLIRTEKLRLARIDAAKKGTADGDAAVALDLSSIPLGTAFTMETTHNDRRENYGRLLADLWFAEDGTWVNLNDRLVERGLATYWDGEGARPRGLEDAIEHPGERVQAGT
jgi:endonuclease YncB( thermonuclease family)